MDTNFFIRKLSNIKLDNFQIFEIKTIKDLDKSPCPQATTEVFDFDKTKEIIVKHYHLQTISSCDGLKVVKNQSFIDFIELKSLKQILKFSNFSDVTEFAKKIKSLNLVRKIIDSNFLIQQLLNDRKFGFSKEERDLYTNLPKRYIIVFDTDLINNPREFIFNSFTFLSVKQKLNEIILKEIKTSELMNIQPPIIKNCTTIDELYKK